MDSPQVAPTTKQKKGLKKLWARVKASMVSKKSSSRPVTTETAPAANEHVALSPPPALPSPERTATEPAVETVHETLTLPATTQPTTTVIAPSLREAMLEEAVQERHTDTTTSNPEALEVDDDDDGNMEEFVQLPKIQWTRHFVTEKQRFEQAQAVYCKYGLSLDASEWRSFSRPHAERVERRPRQRVRYTCHSCKNVYGREKKCSKCGHLRCDVCLRNPTKRPGDRPRRQTRIPSVRTSPPITTGVCHECKTTFTISDIACPNCEHRICEQCLKETIRELSSIAPSLPTLSIDATAVT